MRHHAGLLTRLLMDISLHDNSLTEASRPEPSVGDGRAALAALLAEAPALGLEQVTRQFLALAWACEEAAQTGGVNADRFDEICTNADIQLMPELSALISRPQPWDLDKLCTLLESTSLTDHQAHTQITGALITLEGGDGSGKTSQTLAVAEALRQRGHAVVTTRALGGAPGGSLVLREFILNPDYVWNSVAEGFLTTSILREGLAKVIAPALAEGKFVVCDRLLDTLQVYLCDPSVGLTAAIYERLFDYMVADLAPNLRPHLTFLLDITFDEAMRRRHSRDGGRPDRNEGKTPDFHRTVFATYRQVAATSPRMIRIDAEQPFETLTTRLADIIEERIQHV